VKKEITAVDGSLAMVDIEFGVFLVPEGNTYRTLLSRALLSEELGYHSIWLSDHLHGMYSGPDSPRLECWTTTAALAAATSRVRLGQLAMASPFRHPPLLAKMSATLDRISGGRLELGLGAGWCREEFEAYGYHYGTWRERIAGLDEAAQIVKMMWTQPESTFRGRHYRVEGARCEPKPAQRPHPPLMIAGGGERLTLRTVARHADACNFAQWTGTPEEYLHKLDVLNSHCDEVGRDPDEIKKTWAAFTFIDEDAMRARKGAHGLLGEHADKARIVGTPEEVIEQLGGYVDAGVTLFIISFLGGDFEREARLFAEEVAPSLK
jgi:F420-dependent oxidoreductase-like protein